MYQERLKRLQAGLKKRQIDCLALIPGANMIYMTGLDFHLMERAVIGFFPVEGAPAFTLPTLEQQRVEEADLAGARVFAYADEQGPAEALRQAIRALPEIHSLAVEHLRMRVLELQLVQRHAPNALLADAGPLLDALRVIKSADEIAAMRQAAEIAERALQQVIEWLRPGLTENQIASRLTIAMLEEGSEVLPFKPIVQAGPNAALPHGTPSDRQAQAGEALLMDFGANKNGYISDITRTFMVGQPPDARFREVYEAVKAANAAGRAAARLGIPCQEIDRVARRVIGVAGFGEQFIHRTGHGIGLEGHEGPYIVEGNANPLEAGMTFTVEPGIYLPGEFGVRIEDDMLITPGGAESLTSFTRDLMVIGT